MTESFFEDKASQPTWSDLCEVVGETAELLEGLESDLTKEFGDLTREWRFYGRRAGWTLALGHKGRRILHLIPRSGLFTVVLTLGKRAISACRVSGLPEEVLARIDSAREYAEGRSIRLDVTSPADVTVVMQLAAIKMAH